MADVPAFPVDLSDPERLRAVFDAYLRLGVCPVGGRSPGALKPVQVSLRLPDGSSIERRGTVIRDLPDGFLVQVEGGVDAAALEAMTRVPGSPDPAPAPPRPSGATPRGAVTGLETAESDVYAHVRDLPLPEKQRLARHGRKTVRQLLAKDPNKTLHVLVIANPEITLEEVAEYAGLPGLSREALEQIAANRTWTQSRQVVLNLVRNPSIGVDAAVRLVPRLSTAEWRVLSRPGTVRMPIAAAARKALLQSGGS